MTTQREAFRAFFTERARGVAAVTLLTGAIAVIGYVLAAVLTWVLP